MAEDDEQLWKRECTEYDTHFKLRNVMTGKVLSATEFDKNKANTFKSRARLTD